MRNKRGITLVALVVTIIILLILAGITIIQLTESGLFEKSNKAVQKYEKSAIKEEIEAELINLQIEKAKSKNELTDTEIVDKLADKIEIKITSDTIGTSDNVIYGEYKDYEFKIDENRNVIIGDKLVGEKPIGEAIIIPTDEKEPIEVQIKVTATTKDGEIQKIEAINGAILLTDNGNNEKIFKVTKNGLYSFKIIGTNGRTCIVEVEVTNIVEVLESESLLNGITHVDRSQKMKVKVTGNTGVEEETITYSIDAIVYDGNLVLDGQANVLGVIPSDGIYEFGNQEDVGTETTDASNTILLKVNGDLTINEGVTLTSVKSNDGYGGPKGMIIYCTGKLTNNGTISMTARGAKAIGENVYLWKNVTGTYEFVPKTGANGGSNIEKKQTAGSWASSIGNNGNDGTNRATGGGGSGAVSAFATWAQSGNGGIGTSYSGGSGGGGICMRR